MLLPTSGLCIECKGQGHIQHILLALQERGGGLFSPKVPLLFSPRVGTGLFSPTYRLPGL